MTRSVGEPVASGPQPRAVVKTAMAEVTKVASVAPRWPRRSAAYTMSGSAA